MWRPLMSLFILACGCELPVLAGVVPNKQGHVSVRLSRNENVDVLFVIDSSASMAIKQDRLAMAIPAVLDALGSRGSYHFGAVSSDLGAGSSMPFGCRPGGDGAQLFAVGAGATAAACPGTTDGTPFLVEDLTLGSNNRGAQSLPGALRCMLLAGTGGCPIQQPLEAAHLVLSLSASRKDRFLRADALLVVVYLTDGDDCSLPAGSDLFDSATSAANPLSPFRCTRFGIEYGFPPVQVPGAATGGPLAQAAPMSPHDAGLPGRLVDVNFYRDELRLRLKSDPNDVMMMVIAGPPEPFEIIDAEAGSEQTAAPRECAGLDGKTCLPALKHSCSASAAPELFGSPAVRLRTVVQSVQHHYESPVCSTSQSSALRDFGKMVAAQQTGPGCVAAPVGDGAAPQCDVQDVSMESGKMSQPIPECATGGPTPCWKLVPDPSCAPVGAAGGGSTAQYRIDIDRGGKAAPPGTTARAECAIPAS